MLEKLFYIAFPADHKLTSCFIDTNIIRFDYNWIGNNSMSPIRYILEISYIAHTKQYWIKEEEHVKHVPGSINWNGLKIIMAAIEQEKLLQ